jgi:hypothetical protein
MVALSLSYEYISMNTSVPSYSYNPFKYIGIETYTSHEQSFSVSLGFASNILKENNSIIQPILSFGYTRIKDVNQFGIQLGVSLGGRLKGDFILTLTPMGGYIFVSGTKIFIGGLELAFVSF